MEMAEYQRKFEQFQSRHTQPGEQKPKIEFAEGPKPEGDSGHGATEQQCLDLCPICRTADVLRAALPPETREQLHAVQHEALVAVRALLDHYIERAEPNDTGPTTVQDIPIE